MGFDLRKITLENLRTKVTGISPIGIVLTPVGTQSLFDWALAIHNYLLDSNKLHSAKNIIELQKDLVRKKQIIENELRDRCVTKKITYKRMKGAKIDNYEKMRQHSAFTKFLRDWLEKNSKRIF